MVVDPYSLLPRHKHDLENAEALIALGYPAVAPVLPNLLEWLQDINWPVATPIGIFLRTVPEQMAPLIWDVLRGNDYIWKLNCILNLVCFMPLHTAEQFRSELIRLANEPTPEERCEGLDEDARDVLRTLWPADYK